MKTNILTLMLWGLLSLHMQAADGDTFTANTSEGVEMTFRVISETEKTVSVSTISKSVSGTVSIPSEVVYNNETYLVTVISGWAFFDCDNVTAVNIPTTVTSIEESAFSDCTSLGSVAIPNSVTSIGKAAFQSCGSLQSVVMSENVEYFGSGVFANCTSLESINIPNDAVANNGTFAGCTGLKSITFSNKVTKISAFYGCTGLETIDIPSNIKTIGEEAFAKCTNLASVTLHDGLETIEDGAFNDCDALTSITIPNSVTSIGSKELSSTASGTFGGCDNLKTVTLSNNLTCIPSYVFSGCKKLESINIPTNLKEIRYMAFDGCTNLSGDIVLPQGVTYIGGGAFASTQITSIKIPSTMTYFAANALHGNSAVKKIIVPNLKQWCEQMDFNSNALGAEYHTIGLLHYADLYIEGNENTPIKDVVIPEGVKRINNKAFYDATITSVEIPSSVDSVYRGAFEYCEQLKMVKFNEGLKYIGNDAFAHCTSLESLKLPDGLIELGYAFYQCTGLKSVEIPNSVTTANSYVSGVFSGCTSLESVKIGNGLTIIPKIMFSGCTSLQSIEIPNGVTKISPSAFSGCSNLQFVSLPTSLTEIYSGAFYGCKRLKKIIFPNSITYVDPGVGQTGTYPAFYGCDSLAQVIVPDFNIADWCGKYVAGGPLKYSHHLYDTEGIDLLVDVVIPEGVTRVREYAFQGCESMTSLTLPSTISQIGAYAFGYCSNLTSVTCKMKTPVNISANFTTEFWELPTCTLYIPAGTRDAYIAAGWTEDVFKGGIVELEEEEGPSQGENPVIEGTDMTEMLVNPDFSTNDWTGWTKEAAYGGNVAVAEECAEAWNNSAFDIYQEITNVPDGLYEISVQGFYRYGRGDNAWNYYQAQEAPEVKEGGAPVFIYLNNMTTSFKNVFEEPADYGFYTTQTYTSPNGQYFPDGMISAATAFGEGMFTQRAYGLVQNGETMRIGVKGSSNQLNDSWVIFDNFKLTYHAQNPEVVDIVLQIKSEELGDFIDNNSESMTTSVLESVTTTYNQSTNSNLKDDEKYDVLIATNNALVVAKENVQIVMAYQTALEAYQSACTNLEQYDPNQEEDIWTDINSMNDEIDSSDELDNKGLSDLISRMKSLTYLVLEKVAYLQNPPIEIGGIYYNLDSYTQMATVVSGNTEYEGDVVIPESVEYDDVVYAVTAIGQEAFYDCDNLTSVVIPNSVISIGGYAFANCISMTSIDIPNSVTFIDAGAFNSTHLNSVTIPNGVTSIGHNTFSQCYLLATVTIPSTVSSIDEYAFSGCSNLTDVYCYASILPQTNGEIFTDVDFANATLHVPATTIDDYQSTAPWSEFGSIVALNDEPIIADIDGIYYELNTDAQTATVISGENKYTGDVVIPESVEYDDVVYAVTAIGSSAFESCSDLTSLTIPNSVTTIGGWAFWGCWGLTDIIIPASVVSIGESAFRYCDLTSIQVENGNPIYDSRENCNAVIETASNTLIVGCGNTVIPNGISAIGGAAFSGSHSLTSVTIPESVTSIGWTAFEETGLTDIIIPNSVTSIGAYAFSSTSLSSVFIPNSVTSIGKGAFGIYSITSVQLEDDNPVYDSRENCNAIIETASNTLIEGWKFSTIPNSVTSIGNGAFTGCSEMTSINIPNSVTSIGSEAFWGCGLTSVTIPNSVTYIGSYAFYCSSLTDMYCYASNLPQTNDEIFMDVDFANATLHVPAASIDAYQTTAPWSEFGSIVALDDEPADPDLALVNTLTIANVEVENGNSVVLPVNLNNTESITAIQFEVALPTSNDKINVVYQSDFTEYGQDALPIGYSGVSDNSERQSTAAEPYSGGGAPRLMGSNDHVNHGIYWGARSGSVGQLQFGKYAAISATGETLGDGITEDEALWLEEGDYTLNFRNAAWDDHASPYTVRICMPNTEAIFEETDIVPDVQLAHNGNTPNEDDIPVSEYEFTVTTPGYYYIEFEGNSGWLCWLLTSLSVSAKSDVQNEDPAGITISNCQLTDRKGTNHTASYEQLVNGNYQITVSSLSDDVFSGTEGVVVNLTLDVDGDMSAGAYPIRLTNIELTTDAAQTIQPADASATLTVVNGAEEPVEPVEENNTLVMENLSGRTGTQFLLPVGLLNEDDITALQFNITLPDGVSIAKNSKDKYIVEKTERCEDHTLSASKPGDANVYTVLLYSNDVESITGTDGTVLNVRLEVSEDMEAGDYEVSLSNINLTTVDEVKITPADVTCTLTVTNSIPGDANGDGSIDVTDIVGIANCILGRAGNSFDETAADINGDGDVDVTDIVAVANIILHSGGQNYAKMRVVHDVIDMLDPQ